MESEKAIGRKARSIYTTTQLLMLEEAFAEQPYLTNDYRADLAEKLYLSEQQVNDFSGDLFTKRKKPRKHCSLH